jgi:hypothetical protein
MWLRRILSDPPALVSFFLVFAAIVELCISARPLEAAGLLTTADTPIYSDTLAAGWDDWSWDMTRNLAAGMPVHGGSAAISVHFDKPWAGLYLHADPAIALAGYTHLHFWLHGGSGGGQKITIMANQNNAATVEVTATANQWTEQSVALADLGSPVSLSDIFWQDATGGAQPTFYLDDIGLTLSGEPPPPAGEIILTVDAAAGRRAISPYIYGMNFAPEALAAELQLPINRWGGNATTRYNYNTDIANHASDWYFENIKESDATGMPDDSAVVRFVDQNRRTGTESLLTLPMTGYVSNGTEHACGFAVAKYGPQQAVEPYRGLCGNGVHTDGSAITGNNPLDAAIAAPPSFGAGWINFLKAKYGAAGGGVRFYNLDNEPDIWFETHRDIRPNGWKYQEFRDSTIAYAAAAKAADPNAQLLGPVVNGWTYYWFGAYDGQREDWSTPDDRLANGNMPFVPWYLQQLKQYEDTHGVRLLDYLDLHYYPQASGVSLSPAGSAATQALRLRSTRSLWDPTYVDESWIKDAGPEGGIVQLIPRMKAWVNQYYPGTKLAITEYNWGALDHIYGAVAQADVLGIFGREGLDLATLWAPPDANDPGAFAFRLYRNYDGAGGQFGDTSVHAASSDQSKLAIYAAQRTGDNALTLVIVNKTTEPLTGELTIANAAVGGAAVYRYSAADLTRIVRQPDITLAAGANAIAFPAQSVTLLVASSGPPVTYKEHVYLPAMRRPVVGSGGGG